MAYPYGQTVREAFGEIRGWRRVLYRFLGLDPFDPVCSER
jgi:hypothetical protein